MLKLFLVYTFFYAQYSLATEWAYCNEETHQAYEDVELTRRKLPSETYDFICSLDTAEKKGFSAQNRCGDREKEHCKIGIGGDLSVRGQHDAPLYAWWDIEDFRFPYTRCHCGCFTGDVAITTTYGNKPIKGLLETAKNQFIRVAQIDPRTGKMQASREISVKDFTVGPEKKHVYEFSLSNRKVLKMTDGHPVVVVRNGDIKLVQAKSVLPTDRLLDSKREEITIVGIKQFLLSHKDNLVYNLDTKAEASKDHVILANDMMVGDVYLQNRLSERESRIDNIFGR